MAYELKPLFTWRSGIASMASELTPTQRHVALTLSLHMSEKGDSCFPSILTLCDETGLSNRAVIDALRGLESSGWLTKTKRNKGKGGRGWINEYRAATPERVNVAHSSDDGKSEPNDAEPGETVNLIPVKSERGSLEDVKRGRKTEDVRIARPRDEVWDTLVAVFGPAPTTNKRGAWNVAAKELREQGATPEEIVLRVARYKARWKDAACTPKAIADNWGLFAEDTPASRPVSKIEAARAERRMREQAGSGSDLRNSQGGLVLEHGARDVRHLGEGDR